MTRNLSQLQCCPVLLIADILSPPEYIAHDLAEVRVFCRRNETHAPHDFVAEDRLAGREGLFILIRYTGVHDLGAGVSQMGGSGVERAPRGFICQGPMRGGRRKNADPWRIRNLRQRFLAGGRQNTVDQDQIFNVPGIDTQCVEIRIQLQATANWPAAEAGLVRPDAAK